MGIVPTKKPDGSKITDEDFLNYEQIVNKSNLLHVGSDPNNARPRSNKSEKWSVYLKPIWERAKKTSGKTLQQSHLQRDIPHDVNQLVERLELLLSSRKAGNTSKMLRNETLAICDALKRHGVFSDDQYKNLMLQLSPR